MTGPPTNGKQQSTNVQNAQRRTSNDGRMRWRMAVAEETWWMVGGGGVTTALTTITQNNNQQMSGSRGGGQ